MQKLKTKFVALSAVLIFSSCAGLPQKPSIDICAHDQPERLVYCENNQGGPSKTYSTEETDRWIMFKPEHWGLVIQYIRELETYIRRNKSHNQQIAEELRGVIKASERVMVRGE